MKRHYKYAIALTLFLFLVISSLYVYFSFYSREEPVVINASYAMNADGVRTKTFHAGEIFYVRRDFTQLKLMTGYVARAIVSDITGSTIQYQEESTPRYYRIGTYTVEYPVAIPITTPIGSYVYMVTIMYYAVWFARPIVVDYPPIHFNVVRREQPVPAIVEVH